jgi:glycosyltransferase involved in cell wall biosynthesis
LEEEKNPLLLAEVLARLVADRSRWRLVVCGEGPMADDLVRRAEELGVRDRLEIAGYVPFGPELMALYRGSHALLHVSWTEGLPQVLLEAFAAGTPVVATNVGGVGSVGDAALLVDPGDGDGAARALLEIANDATVRARLVRAGHAYVGARTATVESRRVADFLQDS